MRYFIRILFSIGVVAVISGCATTHVESNANITRSGALFIGIGPSPEGYLPEPGARLLLLHLNYNNPVGFRHFMIAQQSLAEPQCKRHDVRANLAQEKSSNLILIELRPECDSAILIRFIACLPSYKLTADTRYCHSQNVYAPSVLHSSTPKKGELYYLGKVDFEIADIYPHRGTQNYPRYTRFALKDAYKLDLDAAYRQWPFLSKHEVRRRIAKTGPENSILAPYISY